MSQFIPWDELAEGYYQNLSTKAGRPAKDARLVIGAMIIKHKLCLSDVETVLQIQENPYLQYFVGLPGYQMEAPFAPSLFVDIRKRMGKSVFDTFHQAITDVHNGLQEKPTSAPETQEKHPHESKAPPDECSPSVPEALKLLAYESTTNQFPRE